MFGFRVACYFAVLLFLIWLLLITLRGLNVMVLIYLAVWFWSRWVLGFCLGLFFLFSIDKIVGGYWFIVFDYGYFGFDVFECWLM